MELCEHTQKQIRIRVHAHNEFKKLKDEVIKKIQPLIKDLEGKEVLKVDGNLKKKYYDLLNDELKKIRDSFEVVPFKAGYWSKITHFYLSSTEYEISLKLSFNLQTGTPKKEGFSTPNEYKEFYIFLARLEKGEDAYKYKWGYPINKKVVEPSQFNPEEILNVDEQIKQAEKVASLKQQYEQEKSKLKPYNIKELV